MKSAPTIWITGLSRSGKTRLAEGLAAWLDERGTPVQVVDGRFIRDDIGDFLGYSREERIKVSRILCTAAKLLTRNGIAVIATSITPYQESRDINRATLDRYFEIYLQCSVDACIRRDEKQLYSRALRGDLRHFIGVDDPFEVPKSSDLTIDTQRLDAAATLREAREALERFLGA